MSSNRADIRGSTRSTGEGLAEEEDDDWFETSQTVVAAFLVYNGLEIEELRWEHGTCTFYFDNTEELQVLLSSYIASAARVEPQGFNNAFVQVRKQMFDADPSRRDRGRRG